MSTQRALARERKLRADEMAEVHGPFEVSCRRCGTHIKLSTKSTYDPFHWQRHIERCSKRPLTVLKQVREKGKYQRKSRSSVSKDIQATESLRSSRPSRAKGKKALVGSPQLTPDDDSDEMIIVKEEDDLDDDEDAAEDETSSRSSSWRTRRRRRGQQQQQRQQRRTQSRSRSRSRSSSRLDDADIDSSSSPPPKTPPPQARRRKLDSPEDVMFEEYLHRSQRRLTREFSPQPADSWRDWKWSQLKEPVWVADPLAVAAAHAAVDYQSEYRRIARPDLPESFERGIRPGEDRDSASSSSSSSRSYSRDIHQPLSP